MKALRRLTLSRLVVILTCVAVFAMAMRAPIDTDTWWHLRAGEWQVEQRALLRVDYFSHTRFGQPWINHSWLSQLILYAAYTALGDTGLALYTALLATAGMVMVYLQCEGDPIIRAMTVILGAMAAAVFWTPRPQMMSFFLSTVVLYLIWLYRRRQIDRLWLIPPLMAVWANLHGGFAIGFILMVLAAGGTAANWLFEGVLSPQPAERSQTGEESHLWRPAVRLVVVGLVSAAAISLNPYGPTMLLYPFRTVGIGVLRDFIQEWASPDFHGLHTWPFMWMLIGTPLMAAISPKRLDWRDLVLLAGTATSALLAGRNIATFAIVAAPILSLHTDAWLKGLGLRLNWDRPPRSTALTALNWALLLTVMAVGVLKCLRALEPETIAQARRESLPVDAVAYLEENRPAGPLFNSYNWGGYLIWAARDYPVYVDGRTDLYDDELLRAYLDIAFAQPGWDEKLDATEAKLVLIETNSPLAQVLDLKQGWSRVYVDAVASIFIRE